MIDVLIVVVFLGAVATGIIRSYVSEAISFAVALVGVVFAIWFYRPVAALIDRSGDPSSRYFLSFCTVFLLVLGVGFAINWMFFRGVRGLSQPVFDRVVGAAYGVLRGWLLATIMLLAFASFGVQTASLESSRLAGLVLPGSRVLAALGPFDIRARFLVAYRQIEKAHQPAPPPAM